VIEAFLGKRQRRGAHVNVLKIGSRVGVCCTWGNLRFHAVLRRELGEEFGDVSVLVGFGGISTWLCEEGGH
jgi:hypothetical protein